MGLFGIGKKEEKPPAPAPPGGGPEHVDSTPAPPGGTPTDQVSAMQQQGMSQNQIVEKLKSQGFNSTQIFDAMNQAAAKGSAGAPPGAPPAPGAPAPAHAPAGPAHAAPHPGHAAPPPPAPAPAAGGSEGGERFEEIAETIVDEKMEEISGEMKSVKEAQDANSEEIAKLQQAVKDLKSGMDNLHKAIVGKIGEYDQNLLSVGTEIKAMEKVFSKVLPTFTENVNELARVAKKMKSPAAKKK